MPYRPEDRDKINAAYRRWYAKSKALETEAFKHRKEAARERNKKYQEQRNDYGRRMRAEEPHRQRAYSRKCRLKKAEAKAGRAKPLRCEICGSEGKIFFDHCHQTGAFRGWICFSCNSVLGHVKDDPSHLRKLIAYLKRLQAPPCSSPRPGPPCR